MELARLLQRVREIRAGDGEHDDLGVRGLGGEQIGAEVGRVERRAHAADHRPAGLGDGVAGVGLERGAEGVVGGDEEEAVELLLIRRRISATPFDQLSAFHWIPLGEQALPVRSEDEAEVEDDEPIALLGERLDRQRHAGIGDVENGAGAALVVPLARDGEPDVDLVLMVGDEEFDRLAEHGAAEIRDRHARHLDRARAGEVRIGAGLIVHDADDERIGGAAAPAPPRRARREGQSRGCADP